MRHLALLVSSLALPLALIATSTIARADDAPAATDLVGNFVLGTTDGATLALQGGKIVGSVTHPSEGTFHLESAGGPAVDFVVTEKTDCVFDISFSLSGSVVGGIEVDATKLKSVTYTPVDSKDKYADYTIVLNGGDGLVQNIGTDGKLSPTSPSSTVGTSMSVDDMQKAVSDFQANYCKPAA